MRDTNDIFSVRGKTVLVTGGSRGIGAMIARSFAEREARVIISSRKQAVCDAFAQELSGIGECHSLPADISLPEEISRLADIVAQRFGTLDVLVNNAGATWGASLEDYPVAGWDKTMNVNLRAPFLLVQKLLPVLNTKPDDGARIINIASIDGLSPPSFDSYAYSASKAGLIMLTRHLAKTLGPRNIRVNAVAPGFFRTDMMKEILLTIEQEVHDSTPLGRMGEADDIGGVCLFLASRASAFIHGAVIPCDGGLVSCGK
ncbi:glucose 1-dehydrogenase [Novosphingobium colocasiae]|uniref:glucose 1-dehydrogenase n=1 Tax=Novosphingobium colocasiae TaxID=1256513 RepID=UPI0035AE5965